MTHLQAAQLLQSQDHILILTHRRPDGDTVGCAAALCLALQKLGKTAWVLPNEDAHSLFDPYWEGVLAPADFVPSFVVAVDTAAETMLPPSAAVWQGKIDLCIDHHGSNAGYARATCVDAGCAACGELLYQLLLSLGVALDNRMALLLYMAIATDTGCFVYSNTTAQTHAITAALFGYNFDAQWVNKRHFRVKSKKRMKLEGKLADTMLLEQHGTLVFACIPLALVQTLALTEEDMEDISAFIGQVEGVVNAVTIRELAPGECKISLRTDGHSLNASAVCALHGGGGHTAAAGCTIYGSVAHAIDAMRAAIEQVQHG